MPLNLEQKTTLWDLLLVPSLQGMGAYQGITCQQWYVFISAAQNIPFEQFKGIIDQFSHNADQGGPPLFAEIFSPHVLTLHKLLHITDAYRDELGLARLGPPVSSEEVSCFTQECCSKMMVHLRVFKDMDTPFSVPENELLERATSQVSPTIRVMR